MKTISQLAIACCALLFASCGDIQFPEEMPIDGKALSLLPESCQGSFMSIEEDEESADTFQLTSRELLIGDEKPLVIGEDFTVRQKGDWYFANFIGDEGWYFVMPFRAKSSNTLEYGMFILEGEEDEQILSEISPFSKTQDDFFSTYQVKMNDRQFNQLMESGLFQTHLAVRK